MPQCGIELYQLTLSDRFNVLSTVVAEASFASRPKSCTSPSATSVAPIDPEFFVRACKNVSQWGEKKSACDN